MIQNSEILITGGYGFIGAHLAQKLAGPELGNNISVLDINGGEGTTGSDLNLREYENVELVTGSILDPESIERLAPEYSHIIHAAGFLGIQNVADDQALTLDTNILGTRNCLDFAARHETKPAVIYFSTSEIYGIQCAGPAEYEPAVIPSQGARWCYATAKIAGEYYLRAYNQQFGVKGSIIRPFNVFGPHRYGSNAITTLATRAIRNEDLEISGDGKQIRAWCYIDDFCDGALRVAESAGNTDAIEAYNIGDDSNVMTMLALAAKIIEIAGSDSKVTVLDTSIEDVFYRIPDIDKAREQLGYCPTANFDESMNKVIAWLKNRETV